MSPRSAVKWAERIGLFEGSLFSTLVVVLVLLLLREALRVEIFAYSVFFIPVGAFLVGALSALGYGITVRWIRKKPDRILYLWHGFLGVLAITVYQLMAYRLEQFSNGVAVSDIVTLRDFVRINLTRHLHPGDWVDSVTSVQFIFSLLVLQVIAFFLGSYWILKKFAQLEWCHSCAYRMQPVALKRQYFAQRVLAKEFLRSFRKLTPLSKEYFESLTEDHLLETPRAGSICLETELFECPACHRMLIRENVEVYFFSVWLGLPKYRRVVRVPSDKRVLPDFSDMRASRGTGTIRMLRLRTQQFFVGTMIGFLALAVVFWQLGHPLGNSTSTTRSRIVGQFHCSVAMKGEFVPAQLFSVYSDLERCKVEINQKREAWQSLGLTCDQQTWCRSDSSAQLRAILNLGVGPGDFAVHFFDNLGSPSMVSVDLGSISAPIERSEKIEIACDRISNYLKSFEVVENSVRCHTNPLVADGWKD